MAAANFNKCLSVILHHEGGFVNHPSLDLVEEQCYEGAWLTKRNWLNASYTPFKLKARLFMKKYQDQTQEIMSVRSMAVSTTHLLGDCATPIILGKEREKIYQYHSATGGKQINAERATFQLMERVGGLFAKVITAKDGAKSCALFALRSLVESALNAGLNTRIMFTTSIIPETIKKILQLARQSKAQALSQSRRKSQNASSYAQIATG